MQDTNPVDSSLGNSGPGSFENSFNGNGNGNGNGSSDGIELFSTCPPIGDMQGGEYLERVIEVARWSERAGCTGILVYSDNSQIDPWLVSGVIIRNTRSLCPLIAVQPVYMHPYTVAKNIASIAKLHGRRVYLNMVAGGFRNDLAALNDNTPHDQRYERLAEYTTIIMELLKDEAPVTFEGRFCSVRNLQLSPHCPKELLPGIFISGSSEAGLAAARRIGATAIKYPKPVKECQEDVPDDSMDAGIRIGIISREGHDDAWTVARHRFPEDRKGQLTHKLAMKVSDSVWHKQLSDMAKTANDTPYWLVPFENYKTMCPYLVGDYREVGRELAEYIALGYRTFITDIPAEPDELDHIGHAFTQAVEFSGCRNYSRIG